MTASLFTWKWDTIELDNLIKVWPVRGYFDTAGAMSPAVQAIGAGWQQNWYSQGSRVGGWKQLSPYTIAERKARGYNPTRPILRQSGSLEAGAITPFANWADNQTRHTAGVEATPGAPLRGGGRQSLSSDSMALVDADDGTIYYGRSRAAQSGTTRVVASLTPRRFFANISGAKAMNQTGGSIPVASKAGWTKLAARPFWFFDDPMINAATAGIVARFEFFSFRYFPHVTDVSTAWQGRMVSPAKPSVGAGPMASNPWATTRTVNIGG